MLQGFDVSTMAYFNGDTFFVNLLASLYRGLFVQRNYFLKGLGDRDIAAGNRNFLVV